MSDSKLKSTSSATGLKDRSRLRQVSSRLMDRSTSKISSHSRSRLHASSRHRMHDDDDDGWLQGKDPVKPAEQLDLTDEQLDEEFTRILRADNPHAPDNIVVFSFKDETYKQLGSVDQCEFHFTMTGNLIHTESDEYRRQNAAKAKRGSQAQRKKSKPDTEDVSAGDQDAEGQTDESKEAGTADAATGGEEGAQPEGETDEKGDANAEEDAEDEAEPEGNKPLRNQFNYSERATQSKPVSMRERATMTEAPRQVDLSGSVTFWGMYDAYVADLAKKKAKESGGNGKITAQTTDNKSGAASAALPATEALRDESTTPWGDVAKIVDPTLVKKMERMINLNTFNEVALDFKFWDDPSDQFKPGEGSLLPLWKFLFGRHHKKAVTFLRWSSRYSDLVLATFGSFEFATRKQGGFVCGMSLKNPSHPDYVIGTASGALCVDAHAEQQSLIAAGMNDGTVAVYDLAREDPSTPIAVSTAKTGKHTEPVWQIQWHADDADGNKNFTTVSSDGRVSLWTLNKTDLYASDILHLRPVTDAIGKPDAKMANKGTSTSKTANGDIQTLDAGTCFAFSDGDLFLVGTEDGLLHKCSKAYSSQYLQTFNAHTMAIYSVQWNPICSHMFITCSADWTVKIWDQRLDEPIFVFDLGNAVGDVCWSPLCSTVFAAVTTDGRVHVFDLAQDKYDPLCVQQVVRKAHLTRISFNPAFDIVAVGDDRGSITTFKLSPNLRKSYKDAKNRTEEAQRAAMDKVLSTVLEDGVLPAEDTQS